MKLPAGSNSTAEASKGERLDSFSQRFIVNIQKLGRGQNWTLGQTGLTVRLDTASERGRSITHDPGATKVFLKTFKSAPKTGVRFSP
jgi:hypothetical protein